MNTVVVFTLDGCIFCEELKNRLNEEKINFLEIEINSNPIIWEQVVQQTNYDYLPTVFIKLGENNNGPVFVPSIDYEDNDDLISQIREYL